MIDELQDSLLGGVMPIRDDLENELWELCGRHSVDVLPSLIAFKVSKQLRIGINDLLEQRSPHVIAASLSDLAESLLQFVVSRQEPILPQKMRPLKKGVDSVESMGFIVLAMGKFGGREMNYASDVDVVFLYDEKTARDCLGEYSDSEFGFLFGEIANKVLQVFNQFTPQGRLYEVDSRLRPGGRSGPIVSSLEAFQQYFSPEGLAAVWERQALVKARAVIGGETAVQRVKSVIHEAVYDHNWKESDLKEIYAMRLRMEETAAKDNLKRGPGGVVDIEFLVQALQLIYGKNNFDLQTPNTLAGLDSLALAGIMKNEMAQSLRNAYDLLRKIEGRLRLLDVRLGHVFPKGYRERNQLANLLNRENGEALAGEVFQTIQWVRSVFDEIFSSVQSDLAGNKNLSESQEI